MDTHNETRMPIGDLSSQKMVVGAKQIRKAICGGSALEVFLARNADPALTDPIRVLCDQKNIPYVWVRSRDELGRACGIEVAAAAAAAVR